MDMQTVSVLGPYHDRFLADYWQKRPLLIRGAFPGGIHTIDPDSLAGLACQEGCDSRIVLEKGDYPWQTHQGPFAEDFFAKLPPTHWTLLVQAVDRLVPEVSALRNSFRFIPNWRLDDIMISYAADQGSVGPHTDHYDVFLIQAQGQRRWQFGNEPLDNPQFVDGLDMKILQEFKADQEFILEPGDMLYLPPRVAHHGVAVGECMTYSIGFRAPHQNELLVSFSQFLLQNENPERFYQDRAWPVGRDPGVILDSELASLRTLMADALQDETTFRRWVGAFLTEPRSFHEAPEDPVSSEEWPDFVRSEDSLEKVEGGRFAYHVLGTELFLAVEGETLVLSLELLPLVQLLCRGDTYPRSELLKHQAAPGYADLLTHLWNQGYLRRPYQSSDLDP